MKRRPERLGSYLPRVILAAIAIGLGFMASAAQAEPVDITFTVNTTADGADAAPDGQCETEEGNGVCTLRAAISEANFLPTNDIIVLGPHVYFVVGCCSEDDANVYGDLDVASSFDSGFLTIQGAGMDATVIQGPSGLFRHRVIDQHHSALFLKDLTVRNGRESAGVGGGIRQAQPADELIALQLLRTRVINNAAQEGGGIYALSVQIYESQIISNSALAGQGGGIYTPILTLRLSEVLSNTAPQGGGAGIYIPALLAAESVIDDCRIAGNKAKFGGGLYVDDAVMRVDYTLFENNEAKQQGGGILVRDLPETTVPSGLHVVQSTVRGNKAGQGGGAFSLGSLALDRTTVSGNSASSGGGVSNAWQLYAVNSTISGNSATSGAGGIAHFPLEGAPQSNLLGVTVARNRRNNSTGAAAGIDSASEPFLRLEYALVADNTVLLNTADDCSGTVLIIDYSLVETASLVSGARCLARGNTLHLLTGDPKLGPLADNGGLTLTHLPAPDSPAVDAGSIIGLCTIPPNFLYTDQRNVHRPTGTGCDVGAVEYTLNPPTPTNTPIPTHTPTRTPTPTPTRTPTPTKTPVSPGGTPVFLPFVDR